jgi:predicted dehydrogenase
MAAYAAFPERCKIVALCDIVLEKCTAREKKCRLIDANLFTDHKQMLSEMAGEIDLVSVCTPPFTHAEIAIDCLNAGINVVVEKPMASSLQECDAMLEAEAKSGKMLACIAQNRFREAIIGLKKALDSGLAGRITAAQIDSFWWRGLHYYDLWWRGTWQNEGGGCTLNHAVHHIDMLIWMMGMPQKVTAVLSNAAHPNAEVEDISLAALQYGESEQTAPGALAQVTSSVIHHGEEQQLIFQCEKARISAPWKVHASIAAPNGFEKERDTGLEARLSEIAESVPGLEHALHEGEIDDVLSALEQKRPPAISGKDGRATVELISAIYKAGTLGQTVTLPLSPDDPFYTVEGVQRLAPRFYQKTASVASLDGVITLGGNYKG